MLLQRIFSPIAMIAIALITGLASTASAQNFPYFTTNYDEQYRNQFHFSAQDGWLNDANGMWYANGVYHLAYQSFAYGLDFEGQRSWGHATSPDMIHWTQQPIMLDPNVVPGDCWSGSTVIDTNNTSGFKTGANPVWVSIYTATNEGTCLAYSNDLGVTWQPYAGNPVLYGPGGYPRDPHVFWYAPTSKWVLVLYNNGTTFYTSTNLTTWTQVSNLSSFGDECPDLYQLPVDGNSGNMKWVLQEASGNYLLGQFNGTTFTPDAGGPYPMDVGPNFYASQTFNRASFPDSRVVQIAWGSSYNQTDYTQPWNQNMTFPCAITLATFPEGVRVARNPIAEISNLYGSTQHYNAQTMTAGQNLLSGITSQCCDIQAVFNLSGATAQNITFTFGNMTFTYNIPSSSLLGQTLNPINNQITIRILRDWGQMEVFGNNGEFSYSQTFAFTPGNSSLSLTADGNISLVSADFRNINRSWPGTAGVPAQTIDDADPSMIYSGAWSSTNDSTYYKSTAHYSANAGDFFQTSFIGTQIDWWGLVNSDLGMANVYIDGVQVASGIDCYGTIRWLKRLFTISGLSNGMHTIKVVTTGNQNPASTGIALVHDFLVTNGPIPMGLNATVTGNSATLNWTALPSYVTGYNVKRSTASGGPYTTIASNITSTTYQDNSIVAGTIYYYVVSAIDSLGEGSNSAQLVISESYDTALPLLTSGATVIGTPGSWNNDGNTIANVFDNNTSTFFDAPDPGNGDWAGLDLGSGNTKVVTCIRYCPRPTLASRMVGGFFQGSNTANFSSGVTTLFAVPSAPSDGVYTTAAIPANLGSFRYLRYLSPNGAYGNVSEVKFYGVSIPAAPTGVTVAMLDGTGSLSWNAVATASGYNVKRAAVSGGPYTTVASNVTSLSFQDTGPAAAIYYYVISAVNQAGEGPNSAQVTASDLYSQWLVQNGRTPGAAGTGFGQPFDSSAISNGVEYMVPAGLSISPGASGTTVTALVYQDPQVTVTLWSSLDLITWTQVSFPVAADQSGVPAGFIRMQLVDTANPGVAKKFYRIQVAR
jgi:fructan beta-fructosidase